MSNMSCGLGKYSEKYKLYGEGFWGTEPASFIKLFSAKYLTDQKSLLDLGSGTGRNSLHLLSHGKFDKATLVEVDSTAQSILANKVAQLEDDGVILENTITYIREDVTRLLKDYSLPKADVVVMYGLLHVFESQELVRELFLKLGELVTPGGYIVFQSLTDKYPAPHCQPELEGIVVNENDLYELAKNNYEIIEFNNDDITHSHQGQSQDHTHGSVRFILTNSKE